MSIELAKPVAAIPRLPTRRHRLASLEGQIARIEAKAKGQFFTPPPVANFMASMFRVFPRTIRILDPGAGIGVLSCAVCDRILRLRAPRTVEVHAYENDIALLDKLRAALTEAQTKLAASGHQMSFCIHAHDFVLMGPSTAASSGLFGMRRDPLFDIVVMNPPYLKTGRDSAHARAMSHIVHGQPNLYAFFMARGIEALRPGGQMVAITPRSFCNGPYFRRFRKWLLANTSIDRLHLFESRTAAFAESDVLQENIITHLTRANEQRQEITVTLGASTSLSEVTDSGKLSPSTVVGDPDGDAIIRVPTTEVESMVLAAMERWPGRFADSGLRISTGPVVRFRATRFLQRSHGERGSIPLLSVHNVQPFRTVWPSPKSNKDVRFRVTLESRRLLIAASNYALLRRFSAKEERRRLNASPLLRKTLAGSAFAIENHVNYIYHAQRSLTESETWGVVALLNSRLLDTYYRTVSGSTQVNAAEIRAMPFPGLDVVRAIGAQAMRLDHDDDRQIESLILDTLGINGSIRQSLLEIPDAAKAR